MKHFLLIIAIFSTSVLNAQSLPSYVPTNGLIGWWPFNGNANDESPNYNNDATVHGADLTADRFGMNNSAYEFLHQNADYAIIPYSSIWNTDTFTVSAWANRYGSGVGGLMMVARYQYGYSSPHGECWQLGHDDSNSNNQVRARIVLVDQTACDIHTPSPSTNAWHNYIMSVEGNHVKLYIDGVFIDSMNTASNINTNSLSPISIGVSHQANGNWEYFNGMIDDIGIWNRALDSSEIYDLYASIDNIGVYEIDRNIVVSPNPTSGVLKLELTSAARFEIFNISGQKVAQGKTEGRIDITNLPPGNYQLLISNELGFSTHSIQKI
jgi:hypothetical protein